MNGGKACLLKRSNRKELGRKDVPVENVTFTLDVGTVCFTWTFKVLCTVTGIYL